MACDQEAGQLIEKVKKKEQPRWEVDVHTSRQSMR